MEKVSMPVCLILCVVLCALPGPSLSQASESQSPAESQRQQMEQIRKEQQQRAQEMHDRHMQQQEERWQRVNEQERQRLEKSLPGLPEEERQRRLEFLRRNEEQHRQMMQRQQESWDRQTQQKKQMDQRREEDRLKQREEQKLVKKVTDEYTDEVWREALGVSPAQWQAIKPRLERIHQLKRPIDVDISVYWLAGSTGYQEEALVGSPEGPHSVARASGWFSVTSGAGSVSESYTESGADGQGGHTPPSSGYGSFSHGQLISGQSLATTRTATGPQDPNRGATGMGDYPGGSAPGPAVAGGSIKYAMQIPGPVKKQVGDIDLGWLWQRPSQNKSPDKLTEGDKACEQVLDALEAKNPDQARQRLEALRQIRAQRLAEVRETQQQLRALLTPEQETKMVLMGYLD